MEYERKLLIRRLAEVNQALQVLIMKRVIERAEWRRKLSSKGAYAMKMAQLGVWLLVVVWAGAAQAQPAQPGNFTLEMGPPGPDGVVVTMTWTASVTPNATYHVVGSYNDNTVPLDVALPATARSYNQLVPYHVSGTAQPLWRCVYAVVAGKGSENTCNGLTIPARLSIVKDIEILAVEYDEPRTNPDGSVLDDLAKTTVYGQVDGGPRITFVDIPASSPAGGQHKLVSFPSPKPTGNLTVWVTATDTSGNEGAESARPAPKKLGVAGKGTISIQTVTQ